jgi:hypothetical protein
MIDAMALQSDRYDLLRRTASSLATATADDLINHPSSNDNERVDFLHAASSHFLQYERREMT